MHLHFQAMFGKPSYHSTPVTHSLLQLEAELPRPHIPDHATVVTLHYVLLSVIQTHDYHTTKLYAFYSTKRRTQQIPSLSFWLCTFQKKSIVVKLRNSRIRPPDTELTFCAAGRCGGWSTGPGRRPPPPRSWCQLSLGRPWHGDTLQPDTGVMDTSLAVITIDCHESLLLGL